MTFLKLHIIIQKLRDNPKDKALLREYKAAYKEALKDNPQCNGYCENPYICNGSCYEY